MRRWAYTDHTWDCGPSTSLSILDGKLPNMTCPSQEDQRDGTVRYGSDDDDGDDDGDYD